MKKTAKISNYSARAENEQQQERLLAIERVYGVSPSGIASHLMRKAADCGPEHYHVFMKEVDAIALRLKAS